MALGSHMCICRHVVSLQISVRYVNEALDRQGNNSYTNARDSNGCSGPLFAEEGSNPTLFTHHVLHPRLSALLHAWAEASAVPNGLFFWNVVWAGLGGRALR